MIFKDLKEIFKNEIKEDLVLKEVTLYLLKLITSEGVNSKEAYHLLKLDLKEKKKLKAV